MRLCYETFLIQNHQANHPTIRPHIKFENISKFHDTCNIAPMPQIAETSHSVFTGCQLLIHRGTITYFIDQIYQNISRLMS